MRLLGLRFLATLRHDGHTYFNLKKVCDERLDGQYKIEVVDLVKSPDLARSNNIMACPTMIKESPFPKRVIIGDLSRTEMVLAKLDFPAVPLVSAFSKGAKSVSFQMSALSLKEDSIQQLEQILSLTKIDEFILLIVHRENF